MSSYWYRVGHVTDQQALTGCTAIIFDQPAPAVVDVRGGAPGTRETTLLGPGQHGKVDAISLSGGSAFGLSTADGIMRYLGELGRGFPTAVRPVPLVPAAIIFDLAVGDPIHPDADWAYRAAREATYDNFEIGAIGAGTGATVAKLGGKPSPSGLGWGFADSLAGRVAALIVVNAVGDVVRSRDGAILRGAADPEGRGRTGAELMRDGVRRVRPGENTTIGCVLVDGALDRYALQRAVIAAHDGLARCVHPAHTPFDGDTLFVVARDTGAPDPTTVASLCVAVTDAVESAVISLFED